MTKEDRTARKVTDLQALLDGRGSMLIGLQDNPDPDALAAAAGLRKFANVVAGVSCSLACDGTLGRAENRALLRYLDLNLRRINDVDVKRFDLIALVDTQPQTGNNSLPGDAVPDIVIDHHPKRKGANGTAFTDIRSRYGATATILWEYLTTVGVTPEAPLATALLYGIRSDTQDFDRDSTRADMTAYEKLYPLANKRMLGAIQRGQVPSGYFRLLARALNGASLTGESIHCTLGPVDNPDMIAEVADLLLRHEAAQWSLCWGTYQQQVRLSVRTSLPDASASEVVKQIVSRKGTGGGHNSMAGGQIPAPESARKRKKLDETILRRFLKATGSGSAPTKAVV